MRARKQKLPGKLSKDRTAAPTASLLSFLCLQGLFSLFLVVLSQHRIPGLTSIDGLSTTKWYKLRRWLAYLVGIHLHPTISGLRVELGK